ncbi:hypothetical protein AB0B28_17535 [Glycomyces sp. NPDC046736]|uniref:hypothetical protein n=1 Tax=Glycomyces sp. NPDC046736 TaxID=3155615 RepID=UPI00340C91A4
MKTDIEDKLNTATRKINCEHDPFGPCSDCKAQAQRAAERPPIDPDDPWVAAEVREKHKADLAATEAADPWASEAPGPVLRSDGAVLFRADTTYLVFAGGTFGGTETYPKLEALLKRDGVTLGKFTTAKGAGARKREVGAEVVYTIYSPADGGAAHRMQAEGSTEDIDLGGARGNVAADVVLRRGEICFEPPSDWDDLTDKEGKILDCLEAAGKWISAPALAKLVQAEHAKPGKGTGGFSDEVVKAALEALVKLGEAEGPIRRKYKYKTD